MRFIKDLKSVLNLMVVVAGLGYFVDMFDITLYGVVRVSSLKDLGITDAVSIASNGVFIYNAQMAGLILGGMIWGNLADRKGRLSVMFGSILLYSFANLASAFVWSVDSYAACRFLGGIGLAGELGAAITLVAESLPKEKRGLGTTLVATLGMFGIVAAAFIGQHLPWKMAYVAGGVMGLLLLFTRFKVSESELFTKEHVNPGRANPMVIIKSGKLMTYLSCILIGAPIYFTTGVLFTFAPELTAGLGVKGVVTAGDALLYGSIGLAIGDLLSGLVSQWLKSRKRAVGANLVIGFILVLGYVYIPELTPGIIYTLSFLIGITVGYWAVLVTMAAEQFGTDIRGTVATTVPNFVRGTGMIATTVFLKMKLNMPSGQAALIMGTAWFGLALMALTQIDETFDRDLSFEDGSARK